MPTEEVKNVDPTRAAEYLRDEMMSMARKEFQKPWAQMSASDQEWAASRVETMCKTTVWHIVQAISGAGRDVVRATLGPLAVDKNLNFISKITFDALADDDKLAVVDHINRGVHVVLMDATEYQTYQSAIEITPDEPKLPLADMPQPDWPTVLDAVTGQTLQEGPPDAAAAARVRAQLEEDDAQEPIPASLMRRAVAPKPDAPDAFMVDEEIEQPPEDSLLDEEDMPPEEVAKTVDIPNPTTRPRQRARK